MHSEESRRGEAFSREGSGDAQVFAEVFNQPTHTPNWISVIDYTADRTDLIHPNITGVLYRVKTDKRNSNVSLPRFLERCFSSRPVISLINFNYEYDESQRIGLSARNTSTSLTVVFIQSL